MNTLPPKGSHTISLGDAIKEAAAFRKSAAGKGLVPQSPYVQALGFNRDIFDEILKVPGCCGLRFYFGLKQEPTFPPNIAEVEPNHLTLIFCAIDGMGNDILKLPENGEPDLKNHDMALRPSTLHLLGNNPWPCPAQCDRLKSVMAQ
jgi:hypothetical protein